ncbi:uncharacterized protein LOC126839154 [Adelges cooleyi]|uniref:uncharacterized protein LOC126839154 n=1 Tax=Adelges cooleyi TaxID=133065 RepID=UPI00218023B3|nr:uncharacterized protein LOC126839154 [Adelges cooleyi]
MVSNCFIKAKVIALVCAVALSSRLVVGFPESDYDRLQLQQIKLQEEIQEKLHQQQLIQQQILLLQPHQKISQSIPSQQAQSQQQIQQQAQPLQSQQLYIQEQSQPGSSQMFIQQQLQPEHKLQQQPQPLDVQQQNEQRFQAQVQQQNQQELLLKEQLQQQSPKFVRITEVCLACICEAMSSCNRSLTCEGDVCGPFRITWAYWSDAGKPVLYGDNPNDGQAFARCANDLVCSKQTVLAYTSRFAQDCNGDGQVDCWDYASIHILGGYGCRAPLSQNFKNKFETCQKSVNELSGSPITQQANENIIFPQNPAVA